MSTGRTAIERLIHIVVTCPSIAPEAFQLCLQHIHKSRDPSLYQSLLNAYEQASASGATGLPDPLEIARLDTRWTEDVMARNMADKNKLEVELKSYTNNMIKESIRVRIPSCIALSPVS